MHFDYEIVNADKKEEGSNFNNTDTMSGNEGEEKDSKDITGEAVIPDGSENLPVGEQTTDAPEASAEDKKEEPNEPEEPKKSEESKEPEE